MLSLPLEVNAVVAAAVVTSVVVATDGDGMWWCAKHGDVVGGNDDASSSSFTASIAVVVVGITVVLDNAAAVVAFFRQQHIHQGPLWVVLNGWGFPCHCLLCWHNKSIGISIKMGFPQLPHSCAKMSELPRASVWGSFLIARDKMNWLNSRWSRTSRLFSTNYLPRLQEIILTKLLLCSSACLALQIIWEALQFGPHTTITLNRETTMKIRAVMMFIIAQVVLAKQHTSRRCADAVIEAELSDKTGT